VPFGSVDVVGQVPGGVRVAGWVIDPDADGPANVHIYVDDRFVAPVLADDFRADIAAAYPKFGPAKGFEVVVPVGPGTHNICAYVLDTAGDPNLNRLVACRVVEVQGRPFGNLERVSSAPGGVRVEGWTLDPETTDALDVHVYVDGNFAGVGRADNARGDIAATFPAHGPAHGFDFVVATPHGRRDVCVYAIDGGSGVSGNATLGCRTVALGPTPFGSVDGITRRLDGFRIVGWAIDPATRDAIAVHVYLDGRFAGAVVARDFRADVEANHGPYGGAHGFELVVPDTSGARQVCVYAVGTTPGVSALLRCANP
jgi:hypothetical protein